MNVRIVLADDHPAVRKGLIQVFSEEGDLEVVAECCDGETALVAIREHAPDVAVVDLRMPRATGLDVLKRLQSEAVRPPVILLVGNISDDEVMEAMRLGVKGIVLKEFAPSLLVQSVRKVASGGVWLEKESVARVLDKLLGKEERAQSARSILTAREIELTVMTAGGLSNREIAEKLFISEGTVKSHLHTIFEKLSIKGRMQLAQFARENSLV